MKKTMIALSMAALFGATSANAMDFDPSTFYYGGSYGIVSVDGFDDTSGFSVFAGMPLEIDLGEVKSSAEVGYRNISGADYSYPCWSWTTFSMSTCTATTDSSSGLYIDYVAAYPVADQVDVLGIVGLDLNSDMDMLEYGVGAEFKINDNFGARFSYLLKGVDGGGDLDIMGLSVTYRQ